MEEEIQAYLLVKAGEGLAKSTLYEYGLYLYAFAAHCGKKLCDVDNGDVAAWVVVERGKGYAEASILSRVRTLRGFLNWCVEDERLVKSPLKMKNPRVTDNAPHVAPLVDVQKLLRYPVADWLDYRNRALVHVLLDTGMRIGEACGLQLDNVDCTTRMIQIPSGKNKRWRPAPCTVGCIEHLRAYLDVRPDCIHRRWIFLGSWNQTPAAKLTTGGARTMLQAFCERVGVPYINPHSIRHLFAVTALNAGLRAEIVSKILGHHGVDFTLKFYAKLLTVTIQKEYDVYWKIDENVGHDS